jgi:predicted MFS family arabinose efflux permease
MLIKLTGLWKNNDFVRLWSGQTISVFGSIIGGTAMSFTAILFLKAGPFEIALLNAMHMVPAFLIGLFAGAWVDRLRRRPVLIGVDLGRAIALATIPLAAFLGVLHIVQLYLVALLVSVLTIFFDLAYQAYLPGLVGKENIVEGNSKLSASASVSEFAGFSLAGWLVQLFTAPMAVLIDALSFVISAVSISSIRVREGEVERALQADMRREIAEGLREVMRQPFLRASAVVLLIEQVGHGIFGALVVLYMSRGLGFEPGLLAMTWAVGGITSLLGASLSPRLTRRFGPARVMVVGLLVSGCMALLVPLASGATVLSIVLLVLAQFGDGFYVVYEINLVSTRQEITSGRILGRVGATLRFLGLGAALLGTFLGGAMGEGLGVRTALFLGAGASLLAALVLSRMLNRLPAHRPAMTSLPDEN